MNVEIMLASGEIKQYRAIENLIIGMKKNGILDRLEMYFVLQDGERVKVDFEEETIKEVVSIKKDGEEIYRK